MDSNENKEAAAQLRMQLESSERLHRFLVDASPDMTFIVDRDLRIRYCNDTVAKLLSYEKSELQGQNILNFFASDNVDAIRACITLGESDVKGEVWIICKPGKRTEKLALELRSMPVFESESQRTGGHSGTYIVARNITEKIAQEKLIHHLAYHDTLTGLPNMALFSERLDFSIKNAFNEGFLIAVFLIDIDKFKNVNDTFGHAVGSELLRQISKRFSETLRNEDTLSRLGGDEFVAFMPNINAEELALSHGHKLVSSLKEPFVIEGIELSVTCSIGISLYPRDGEKVDDLIKMADQEMYKIKGKGKNGCSISVKTPTK